MALIRFFDLQNIAHQYRIQQGKIQPITGSKETLVEMGSEIKILVLETEKKKVITKSLRNLSLAVTWIMENMPIESVYFVKENLKQNIENAICLLWSM